MSKKLPIYIFSGITLFLLLVASLVAGVFSDFGNSLIKAEIQKNIDELSPETLTVKEFSLSPSKVHIYIVDEKDSFFSVDADYSILNFNAKGIYKANIKELKNYKELTEIELQGGVVSAGEFKANADRIDLKGVINIADADIDFDVDITDGLFKKAIINSEAIKIESLLHLLSQPKVASGVIKLNSDITPDKDEEIKGSAIIAIENVVAYRDRLKKAYNAEIPKDADFKGKIAGSIENKQLQIDANIISTLLKLDTKNLLVDLNKMSAQGDIDFLISPIKTELFTIKREVNLLANLKAKESITDIAALSDMFGSSVKATALLDRFEPKKISLNSEVIEVGDILSFLNQPAFSSGKLKLDVDMDIHSDTNIKGKAKASISEGLLYKNILKKSLNTEIPNDINYTSISDIDFGGDTIKSKSSIKSSLLNLELDDFIFYLKNSSFDGEFRAELEPIDTPYFYIDKPLHLEGRAKAKDKITNISANTNLFDSSIDINTTLESLNPKNMSINAPSISLKKLLAFSKQKPYAEGNIDIDANIKDIDSKPTGIIDAKSSNLLVSQKALKEQLNVENPDRDIKGSFSLNSQIKDGIADNNLELLTNVATIKTQKLLYNTEKSSLESDFTINIDDLKSLAFITGTTLYGEIDISNSLSYKDEKILYSANSKTLDGEIDIEFDDYKVDATAKNIDAYKLDEMLGLKKVFKSGKLNMQSQLQLDKNAEDIIRSLDGELNLKGQQLILQGYNIDTIVNNFKSTQSITLLDVGAIVLAGPVGIAATKGLSAGGMAYGGSMGDTTIKELLVSSTIKDGLANADDVAFSTKNNLIAAKGALQLWNNEFKSFWIAVVDKYGCSEYKQRVGGTISDPKIVATESSFEIVKNVVKSVGSIFTDTADSVVGALGGEGLGKNCDKFYSGEVEFPK